MGPAFGYLDQVEKYIEKSRNNELSAAEFALLQNQDLAMLSKYEQAKNLTITLIKDWLIKYKFRNWKTHSTNGKRVTIKEKENRAKEVADLLGNNKYWHSHGRLIGIDKISSILKLKIQDLSKMTDLNNKIWEYNDLMFDYISLNKYKSFFHNRVFFLGREFIS